jgi:hypothetical protein
MSLSPLQGGFSCKKGIPRPVWKSQSCEDKSAGNRIFHDILKVPKSPSFRGGPALGLDCPVLPGPATLERVDKVGTKILPIGKAYNQN